jgi:transforming growth factor-beta-induced protein
MKLNFLWMVAIAIISLGFVACDDDDNATPQPETIAEIAAADAQFSILVDALDQTNLTPILNGAGSYTVFAPTNDAFIALGVDLSTLSNEALTEILLYHVIGAEVMSGDIQQGQTYASTAAQTGPNDSQLSILIEKSGASVSINGSVNVTSADIEATNGVIHVVDAVILPLDIVGHAAANSNFTELVGALGAASGGLVGVLQGNGPFTVFAPVNAAFEEISAVTATLTADQLSDVLVYHVVGGAKIVMNLLSTLEVGLLLLIRRATLLMSFLRMYRQPMV